MVNEDQTFHTSRKKWKMMSIFARVLSSFWHMIRLYWAMQQVGELILILISLIFIIFDSTLNTLIFVKNFRKIALMVGLREIWKTSRSIIHHFGVKHVNETTQPSTLGLLFFVNLAYKISWKNHFNTFI